MPIAVVGYTLRFNGFTKEQAINVHAKMAQLGYDGPENPSNQFWSVDEYVDLLAKYNLKVPVVGGDVSKPQELMALAEKYKANLFSAPSIDDRTMRSVDGFKAHAQRLNELAKPYKGTGYKLKYHNHSQEFRNFPEIGYKTGMSILVEETDPEVICFELDTHWLSAAGCDPVEWINKVSGRIPIIHFKDYTINYKEPNVGLGYVSKGFAEIGNGNINWQPIVEACKAAGTIWYGVEQDECPGDPFDSLKTSIDYMRNTLGIQ